MSEVMQAEVFSQGVALPIFELRELEPKDRIQLVRDGLPAEIVLSLARTMGWTKEHTFEVLQLKRSTVNKKLREKGALDSSASERVLAVIGMVELVQRMVERSGNPEAFDGGKWLAQWLDEPNAALGGVPPSELLDTHEGIEIVRQLLAQMESGAYA